MSFSIPTKDFRSNLEKELVQFFKVNFDPDSCLVSIDQCSQSSVTFLFLHSFLVFPPLGKHVNTKCGQD